SGSLYLCLSISPIATTPIVAAVATLDPDTEPNNAHAPTLEGISPPGKHDSHCISEEYIRSAIPPRHRISPNMMYDAIAVRMKLLVVDHVSSPIMRVNGIEE